MNINQFKKVANFSNWFNFAGQIVVRAIAILVSVIGRTGITIFLAVANGFAGSLAFADLSSQRFMQYVVSGGIAPEMAKNASHSTAHWVGLVVMIALDICIFIFGFVRPKKNDKGQTVDLEPYSKGMAWFSAALGTAGFLAGMLIKPLESWGLISILEITFMVMISSVAPLLLFVNTKYQKAEDGPLVYEIIDRFNEALKKGVIEYTENAAVKPQPKKPATPSGITTPTGQPFDLDAYIKMKQ